MLNVLSKREESIRKRDVTGDQTCAQTSTKTIAKLHQNDSKVGYKTGMEINPVFSMVTVVPIPGSKGYNRSEERRVGKESRSRRTREHSIQNTVSFKNIQCYNNHYKTHTEP